MSSEAITRTDLTNILNEVLPNASVDYIVEQGTSGGWTYRKWNSGKAECWKRTDTVSYTMTSTVSGNGYSSDYWNLPSGLFTSITYATANRVNGGNGLIGFSIYSLTTSRLDYYVWVTGATGTISMQVGLYVFGNWK